ncbi:MAG: hypothetical protein ACRDV4_07830, partial [Acidimicrobiales bacterium]
MLGYLTGFAIVAVVALLRQAGVPAWNSVWAEDGHIFYEQALRLSAPKALTTLYAGYSQLLPRLPAEVARLLPVKDFAPFMAVTGACSLSVIALVVFHSARGHLRSPYARAILVASTVLLPLAVWELLDNVVNVTWWLFFATFWLLLWRPRILAAKVLAAVMCFLAVSSDPLIGLFVPLALLRVVSLRKMSEHAATAGLLAGLVFQAALILHGHGQSTFTSATFDQVPRAFLLQVGAGFVAGKTFTSQLILSQPLFGMALGTAVLAGIAFFTVSARDKRVRAFVVTAVFFAVVTFLVPVTVRGVGRALAVRGVGSNSRYDATPLLLLVSATLVRLQSFTTGVRLRRSLILSLGVLVLAPSWVLDFRDSDFRFSGPAWSTGVAAATSRCNGVIRSYVTALGLAENSGEVNVPISPRGLNISSVTIPCSRLEPTPSLAADRSPPRVRVLKPAPGTTLSGSTVLVASASDTDRVGFWIFGGRFGLAGSSLCKANRTLRGWTCVWNSATVL